MKADRLEGHRGHPTVIADGTHFLLPPAPVPPSPVDDRRAKHLMALADTLGFDSNRPAYDTLCRVAPAIDFRTHRSDRDAPRRKLAQAPHCRLPLHGVFITAVPKFHGAVLRALPLWTGGTSRADL